MKMVISIGANQGDAIETVRAAIAELQNRFAVTAVSHLYRTEPVGGPEQADYINAVVLIDSDLLPNDVLVELQEVEKAFGRTREIHWGPRTLDLDLIQVEKTSSADPSCLLPHPRAHERAFVLLPWLEVDAGAELEGLGKVEELEIPDQKVVRI